MKLHWCDKNSSLWLKFTHMMNTCRCDEVLQKVITVMNLIAEMKVNSLNYVAEDLKL